VGIGEETIMLHVVEMIKNNYQVNRNTFIAPLHPTTTQYHSHILPLYHMS
jgi:hypothetical protein